MRILMFKILWISCHHLDVNLESQLQTIDPDRLWRQTISFTKMGESFEAIVVMFTGTR